MLARLVFYPSLAYNRCMEKCGARHWYDRIDDTVILGALPFRSITQKLLEENVKGVVNMTEKYETRFWVNTPAEWESYGVELLTLSTPDLSAAPTLPDLNTGVNFILKHRALGHSVYVHCKAGRTRSSTLVACYLMQVNGWTPKASVEFIRTKRPHIRLHGTQWHALNLYYSGQRKT